MREIIEATVKSNLIPLHSVFIPIELGRNLLLIFCNCKKIRIEVKQYGNSLLLNMMTNFQITKKEADSSASLR
jgi:hypothetical protein